MTAVTARIAALLVAACLASCFGGQTEERISQGGPTPKPHPPAAPVTVLGSDPEKAPIFAVLPFDATISQAPNPVAPSVRALRRPRPFVPILGPFAPKGQEATGILARVLEERPGYLRVKTLPVPAEDAPCSPSIAMSPYSLEGWVRSDAPLEILPPGATPSRDGPCAASAAPDAGPGALATIGRSGGVGRLCYGPRDAPSWRAAPTTIFWPDGARAGETVMPHLYVCTGQRRVGDLVCFDANDDGRGDGADPPEQADLCLATRDLVPLSAAPEEILGYPVISADVHMVKGDLAPEAVVSVIMDHREELRWCYLSNEHRKPAMMGGVTVDLLLSPFGPAGEASVIASDLGEPNTEACISLALRRWPFAAPANGRSARAAVTVLFTRPDLTSPLQPASCSGPSG